MAKVVYLDRNAFHHIRDRPRHGVTEEDYQHIRNAVKTGKLSIARSVTMLEEHLPVLRAKDASKASVERQLILDLTDESKFIRHWEELLWFDVAFYAYGWPLLRRFTSEFPHAEQYLTPDQTEHEDLLKVVQETEDGKLEVKVGLEQIKAYALDRLAEFNGKYPSFEETYNILSAREAVALAERFGVLDECRAKGIDGLLQIKSVKVFVGAVTSLHYALVFDNCKVDNGYWHDLQHAVVASATDAFVTQDETWRKILERIPIDNFEVIDLKTLAQQVQ